jgi:transcriptional regulator with XRE-family HTH domain
MARTRGADQDDAGRSVGGRIAGLRAERGMTLERLAQLTGFTKGYLSKIENGRKVPPIATLSRIARALHTEIGGFFADARRPVAREVTVVRAGERQAVVRGGSAFGYDYVGLALKRVHKRMDPFIFTFPPDIDKHVFFEHRGEEFLFVLSGTVEFQVGDERFTLRKGDSIYFDSSVPHRGRSVGREAKALVVIHDTAKRQ